MAGTAGEPLSARSVGVQLLPPDVREEFRALTGVDLCLVASGDCGFTLGDASHTGFSDSEVALVLSSLPGPEDESLLVRPNAAVLARRVSPIAALVAGPLAPPTPAGPAAEGRALALVGPAGEHAGELDPTGLAALRALRMVSTLFTTMTIQSVRARRLLSQMTVLNTLGEMVSREPDLDKAVQAILETATVLLDADSGSVMLFLPDDPQTLRIAYAIGLPPEVVRDVRVNLGEGVSGTVAQTGEPVVMRSGQRHHLSTQPRAAWSAALCVPLRAKDRVIGVLNIRDSVGAQEFDEEDLHLAMTFASQAALAIDNCRLLGRLTDRLEDAQSELVEANQVLQQIRTRLENILRSIPAPVLVTGLDGRLAVINAAAEQALGIPKELALHQPLREILDRSEVGHALGEAVLGEGGEPIAGLTEVSMGQPTRRDLQVHVAPIPTPSGRGDGHVLVVTDVTEIQELADLKNELVSITSHEIRTPITAINLAARTLEAAMESLAPDERTEIVQIIVNQSVRLKNLVTNLLDLSKMEAGRALDLDLKEADVQAMLHSSVQAVEQGYSTHGHAFEIQVEPGAERAPMDQSKVEQVVINFLTNAVKYSEPGPVTLRACAEGDEWLRVEVRDRGQGIRPDELPSVFERFQRVGGGDHRKKAGHGLGLHLCKGLVEAHGGRIGVESTLGEGSTFYFLLPRAQSPA